MKRLAAFTLVELLVVIGIIAILMALILPVLRLAREAAESAKCLANLRQMGVAIQMYANQNRGYLVPGDHWGLLDGFWLPGGGNWADILVEGKYFPSPLGTDQRAPDDLPSVLRCPSGLDGFAAGDFQQYIPSSQEDVRGAVSVARRDDLTAVGVRTFYAFNGAFDTGPDLLPFRFLPQFNGGTMDYSLTKLTQFKNSSRLPLIFDGLWLFNRNPNLINARHRNRKMTNLLMADGHAESALSKTLPNPDWYLQ